MPWAVYVGGEMDNEVVPQVLEKTPRGKDMPRRVKVPARLKKKEIETYRFGRPTEVSNFFEFPKGKPVFVPAKKFDKTHPVWVKVNDLPCFKTFDQEKEPSSMEISSAEAKSVTIQRRVKRSRRGLAMPGELRSLLGL